MILLIVGQATTQSTPAPAMTPSMQEKVITQLTPQLAMTLLVLVMAMIHIFTLKVMAKILYLNLVDLIPSSLTILSLKQIFTSSEVLLLKEQPLMI